MSINSITIGGRLAWDAELKESASGTPILSARLGNDRRVNRGGEWGEHTNWVDVSMFGNRAKSLHPYMRKGAKIVVTGELRIREYETRDGGKGRAVEVIASDIDPFCGGKTDSEEPAKPQRESVYADELPF